jgi:hypothetical protein
MHASAVVMGHGLRRRATKLLLCAAGAATLAATATAIPAAASAGPPVTGTGTPLCNAGYSGTMNFLTTLKNGGTATSEEITLQMQFTGCSGGSPVPTAGVYNAKGIVTGAGANDCAHYFSPPATTPPIVNFNPNAHLDGVVNWSPAGTINPSNVGFSKMRIWTNGGGFLRIRLPAAASTVTGSYAPTANLLLRVAQKWPAVSTSCAGPGLTSLKIVPANPSSAISQGTW